MTTTPAARDEREVVSTAPERIYLIIGEECPDSARFEDLTDVSWCEDKIDSNAIPYVKAALAESELAEVRALSVANIMLAVVPGADGMGQEVYAKSVDDVRQAFTKLEDRADKFEAERDELAVEVAERLRRTLALQKERDELRAALERVKASLATHIDVIGLQEKAIHRLQTASKAALESIEELCGKDFCDPVVNELRAIDASRDGEGGSHDQDDAC